MQRERQPSFLRMAKSMRPVGILLTCAGFLLYGLRFDLERYFELSSRSTFIVASISVLYGAALLLFNYLRGDRYKFNESDLMREELSVLRNSLASSHLPARELETIRKELANLQDEVQKATSNSDSLTVEEKEELKNNVKQSLTSDLSGVLLKEIENKYSLELKSERQLKQLREHLERSRTRLRQEIESLGRRGNVNLVIGVLTTLVAVGILSSTVLSQDAKFTTETLLPHFAPRFTLSIFIEIFSFFFLKLYKGGLGEIKYFQNELTNVESKFVALENALLSSNGDCLVQVLSAFSKTERNFILDKGQSTVDIEKMKVDSDNAKNIISTLTNLFKQTKK